jgi:hypothetical protein
MVQRISHKNPINAKNFTAKLAEQRRIEIQKARQNFQQNSFLVDSPVIIYYSQIRNGYTCTCHAYEKPVEAENVLTVEPTLVNHTNKVTEISYSTLSKSPMFGSSLPVESNIEDLLLDDTETAESSSTHPLFGTLFNKGSDCGICMRTGFSPLFSPVGRQFYALTTHNVSNLDGYYVDTTATPHLFKHIPEGRSLFTFKVPKYFKTCSYRIFNNVQPLEENLYVGAVALNKDLLNLARGQELVVEIRNKDFTHVFIEFDLGVETHANFPQFSVSKDYTSFFNLQSVSIELPPSMGNCQVNDIVYAPQWSRSWLVFDVQPKWEGPNQTVLLGTTVQGRLIQPLETFSILRSLRPIER